MNRAGFASGLRSAAFPDADAPGFLRVAMPTLPALVLAGLLAACVLWWPVPFALTGDNAALLNPLLADAFRQLRRGDIPVWTVGRWGGSPLLGDPDVGALYLPHYLGYAVTAPPHARALDVSVALHLALFVLGTVWLLRALGAGRGAAHVAAFVTVVTPTTILIGRAWVELWTAMAYWPWLLGAAHHLGRGGDVRWGLLVAGSLAAQVYAGYPQFALYSGTAAVLWIVLHPGPHRFRRLAIAMLAGATAVGLAAPQVLPGLAAAHDSIRRGPEGTAMMEGLGRLALSPRAWLDVFQSTRSVLQPAKIAPAVFVLAVIGVMRKRFAPRYLAVLTLLLAVMATGRNPAYRALHSLPPFSFFGAPMKLFYVASFTMCILAGLGLDRVLTLGPGPQRVVGAVVLLAALPALAELLPAPWWPLVAGGGLLTLLPARMLGVTIPLLAASASLVFLIASRTLVFDDSAYAGPFHVLLEQSPKGAAATGDGSRYLPLGRWHYSSGNFGALWGVETLGGVGPLLPWRQYHAMTAADGNDPARVLRQWGADPIIVEASSVNERKLLSSGFRVTGALGPLRFLASDTPPLPRYQLVAEARAVSPRDAMAATRAGTAFTDTMLAVEIAALPGGERGDPVGRLQVLEEHARGARLRVHVDRPTWLAARQPFYRNWRAWVDERPAEIYPAGGFLLALLVNAGSHDVVLSYEEPGFFWGCVVAVLSVLLLFTSIRVLTPPQGERQAPPSRGG